MPELNILELLSAELILGELIVGGFVAVLVIIAWNYIHKKGWIRGRKDKETENTENTLKEHLIDCGEFRKGVGDKLDALDARMDNLEVILAEIRGYMKGKKENEK